MFVRFLTVKLLVFFFFLHTGLCGRKSLCTAHMQKCGIMFHEKFLFSFHLFIYSIISFILLLKLFYLWSVGATHAFFFTPLGLECSLAFQDSAEMLPPPRKNIPANHPYSQPFISYHSRLYAFSYVHLKFTSIAVFIHCILIHLSHWTISFLRIGIISYFICLVCV